MGSVGAPDLEAWNTRTAAVIRSIPGTNNWTLLLATDAGEMALRLYRSADQEEIAYEHRLLLALQRTHLPFGIPVPLPTATGATTSLLIWQDRPVVAALFPMLPGRPPTDGNLAHAAASGRALAHLHAALAEMPGSLRSRAAYLPIDRIDPAVPDPVAAVAECGRDPAESRQLAQVVEHVIAGNDGVDNERRQLIHGDLFASNLLVADNAVSAILDFERAGLGPTMMDVAVATMSLCLNPLSRGDRWELAGSLAAGYAGVQQHGSMSAASTVPLLLRRREVTSFVDRIARHQRGEITSSELRGRADKLIQLDRWLNLNADQLIDSLTG